MDTRTHDWPGNRKGLLRRIFALPDPFVLGK